MNGIVAKGARFFYSISSTSECNSTLLNICINFGSRRTLYGLNGSTTPTYDSFDTFRSVILDFSHGVPLALLLSFDDSTDILHSEIDLSFQTCNLDGTGLARNIKASSRVSLELLDGLSSFTDEDRWVVGSNGDGNGAWLKRRWGSCIRSIILSISILLRHRSPLFGRCCSGGGCSRCCCIFLFLALFLLLSGCSSGKDLFGLLACLHTKKTSGLGSHVLLFIITLIIGDDRCSFLGRSGGGLFGGSCGWFGCCSLCLFLHFLLFIFCCLSSRGSCIFLG
mmetsp:Transcript_19304/g.27931  ORF Transcript_19304/g.27931 Transcript_19304/m.27931 type:complete len:280 (-) Transcript_19304:335-1174(-)